MLNGLLCTQQSSFHNVSVPWALLQAHTVQNTSQEMIFNCSLVDRLWTRLQYRSLNCKRSTWRTVEVWHAKLGNLALNSLELLTGYNLYGWICTHTPNKKTRIFVAVKGLEPGSWEPKPRPQPLHHCHNSSNLFVENMFNTQYLIMDVHKYAESLISSHPDWYISQYICG